MRNTSTNLPPAVPCFEAITSPHDNGAVRGILHSMKNTSIPHIARRGLIARVAIQCQCPDTGETGTFLFSGESHRNKLSRVTPVFDDLHELLTTLNRADSNWEEVKTGDCSLGFIFNPPLN